ncbi:MAG TPA: mechanosensitive ion channel domain-containing protein [Burkholderiales bacterium]|nr:mechanosensitive ion channel domain-containing protein [Burkholderiales bacterium]
MRNEEEFGRLAMQLVGDLRQGVLAWQLAALVASLLLAWQVSRLVHGRIGRAPVRDDARVKAGVGGVSRTVFPLTALLVLLVARGILHRFQSAHLLDVAIPLLAAMAMVRAAVYGMRITLGAGGVLRTWEVAISWLVWGGLALHLTGLAPAVLEFLDETGMTIGNQRISLSMVLTGLLTVFIALFVALWIGRLLERRIMAMQHVELNLRVVFTKILRSALVVVAVLVALPVVGIDITVLSVFGGALGVGIGLGLQRVAANYISGITILLDRSISLGDVVTVDGFNGEVTRLTSRCIIVRGNDGTNAIIPNETLITSKVINHSFFKGRALMRLPVQVAYGTDLERALKTLLDVAGSHDAVLGQPAPAAVAVAFGDNGINLELQAWTEDPARRLAVQSDLNLAIDRAFRDAGIQMPFPQREVRLVGTRGETPESR